VKSARQTRPGVLIDIIVVPKSSKNVVENVDGILRVKVRAPPEKGKANAEVVRTLSKIFGRCRLDKGQTTRRKRILIEGKTRAEIEEILGKLAK